MSFGRLCLVIALLLIALAPPAQAQAEPGGEHEPTVWTEDQVVNGTYVVEPNETLIVRGAHVHMMGNATILVRPNATFIVESLPG